MAKVPISTSEAISELKNLVGELRELKRVSNSVGLDSSKSLALIEAQLKSIKNANVKANATFKAIAASLDKNASKNKAVAEAVAGSVAAMTKQVNILKKQQKENATSNQQWLKYEVVIRSVQQEITKLTSTQSKYTNVVKGSVSQIKAEITSLKKLQSQLSTDGITWDEYQRKIDAATFSLNKIRGTHKTVQRATQGTADALKQEIAEIRKEQSAVSTSNRSWQSYENRINKVKDELNQLTSTQKKSTVANKNSAAGIRAEISALKKEQSQLALNNKQWLSYQTRINGSQQRLDVLTKKTKAQTKSQKSLRVSTMSLVKAYGYIDGLRYAWLAVKEVFNLAKQFDSLNFSMKAVIKTQFDVASSSRFLRQITEDFGIDLLSVTKRYIKFYTAAQQSGISMNDTEKIFRSTSKAAAVLSLSTEELSGVYLALEQMLSKGKVTTEELRRQLGERLPGAMGIMASAVGVTVEQLDKMLKKGEVLSAEALPKFAEALELAYGIESVRKVDTLQAASVRLSNSWLQWVRDIATSEGTLNSFFRTAINGANNLLKIFGGTPSEPLRLENVTVDWARRHEEDLRKLAIAELERDKKLNFKYIEYQEQINKKQEELTFNSNRYKVKNNTETQKETLYANQLKLEQELKDLIDAKSKQSKIIVDWEKQESANREAASLTRFEQDKKAYDKQLALIKETKEKIAKEEVLEEKKEEESGVTFKGVLNKVLPITNLADSNEVKRSVDMQTESNKELDIQLAKLDTLRSQLGYSESLYDMQRKMNQVSKVAEPEKPETPKGGTPKINTDEFDIVIAQLKAQIQEMKNEIASGELSVQDAISKTIDLYGVEEQLIDQQYKKKFKLANSNDAKEQIALIEKNSQIEGHISEYGDRRNEITSRYLEKDLKEIQDANQAELDLLIDKEKKKFALLGNNPTAEQEDAFNDQIKDLRKKHNNESLKEQAEYIGKWMDSLNIHGEARVALERRILALLAALQDAEAQDPGGSSKKQEEKIKLDLENLSEFVDEVGSLYDAIAARKIEAIEAEINAEENKYNRLISLAENDASRQEALEQEKNSRLAILEKKKLKEQQKQAKIQKAFALAEIAINTAISISKVASQTGVLSPFVIPFYVALGALQTATVLSQPIPQYKDGLDNAESDHVAMINDGGVKEYVERDGQILSSNTKNAIVNLKKNDTVYKNEKEMMNKSQIFAKMNNSMVIHKIKEQRNNDIIIGKSIEKGFKKYAKINNNIRITNDTSKNEYLSRKSGR